MPTPTPRSTTIRERHRRIIAGRRQPCGICHQPIDYALPHLHPGQFVVDHVVPLTRGGTDTLDNKQPAHRHCNRQKSDKLDHEAAPRYVQPITTTRSWTA